ncbi:MAG: type IV pilus assembly protein PilM [Syntrophales bacterium]
MFRFGLESLFSGKGVVGLDIGSSSLKLTEISDSADGYVLSRFSRLPLPRGVIVGGNLLGKEVLVEKIRQLFKDSGCKAKKVVTSLSGHAVIVKKVGFPVSEEEELRDLLNDEAEKYLPFDDIKEVNFDFQILGESDVMPGQMDVILAAAKKEVVKSYVEAIEKAGLKVVIVDVDSFALETMYEANYDFEEQDVIVLVNIGASITNINVVKRGGSLFTRDFAMGGDSITESIQRKIGVDFDEAEKIKIAVVEGDPDEQRIPASELIELADPIFLEIERSVDYFRSIYAGEYIKKLLLSGGSAKIPGILHVLTQKLNIEAELVNPVRNILFDKRVFDPKVLDDIGPDAAVAVGLSLRRVNDR